MSYIIKNNKLIAITREHYKSGPSYFAYSKCDSSIDANRDYNLVNAKAAKISNAKKWARLEYRTNYATKIRHDELLSPEFLID